MVSQNKRGRSGRDQSTTVAAFFDVDHTLVEANASKLFARYFYQLGLLSNWEFTKAIYYGAIHKLKFINEGTILKAVFSLFKGWNKDFVEECCAKAFELIIKKKISSRVAEHMRFHQSQGHHIVLSTAMPTELAVHFQKFFRTQGLLSSKLAASKGVYTGKINYLNFGSQKAKPVKEYAEKHKLKLKQSYFYADSISDIDAMKLVGNPIAVNPDKKLRSYAKKHRWKVLKH